MTRLGPVEHTGVYVGGGKIVQLRRTGFVELAEPAAFVCSNWQIFVGCDIETNRPIVNPGTAERALRRVGEKRRYDPVSDNCHMFVGTCIWDRKEAPTTFEFGVDMDLYRINNQVSTSWLQWDWDQPAAQALLRGLEEAEARERQLLLGRSEIPSDLADELRRLHPKAWPHRDNPP